MKKESPRLTKNEREKHFLKLNYTTYAIQTIFEGKSVFHRFNIFPRLSPNDICRFPINKIYFYTCKPQRVEYINQIIIITNIFIVTQIFSCLDVKSRKKTEQQKKKCLWIFKSTILSSPVTRSYIRLHYYYYYKCKSFCLYTFYVLQVQSSRVYELNVGLDAAAAVTRKKGK